MSALLKKIATISVAIAAICNIYSFEEKDFPDWLNGKWKVSDASGNSMGVYQFKSLRRQNTGFDGKVEAEFPQGRCAGGYRVSYTFGSQSGNITKLWLDLSLSEGACKGTLVTYEGYLSNVGLNSFIWLAKTANGSIAAGSFERMSQTSTKAKSYQEPNIDFYRKSLENTFCEKESFCYKEAIKREPKAARGACNIVALKLIDQKSEYFKYSADLSIINYGKEGKGIIFPCEFYFNAATADVSYNAPPVKPESTAGQVKSTEDNETAKRKELIEKQLTTGKEKIDAGQSATGTKSTELIQAGIKDYYKAIELDPNLMATYIELSQAFVELKQFKDALGIIEKAIEISKKKKPSDRAAEELANLYHQQSVVLAIQGDIDTAAKFLKLADQNGYEKDNRAEYLLMECRDYFTKTSIKKIKSQELRNWISSTCEMWWH